MKRKTLLSVLCAGLLCLLSLSGCAFDLLPREESSPAATETLPEQTTAATEALSVYEEFLEDAQAEEIETRETEEGILLLAEVTIPDIGKYLPEVLEEAEKAAQEGADFETVLWELAWEKAKENGDFVRRDVQIDLSAYDPAASDRTEEELARIACEYTAQAELDAFALDLLRQLAPEWEEP